MNILSKLIESGRLARGEYPNFIKNNVNYLCIMGSHAYGYATSDSDKDIYGFCVPPKNIVFPEQSGLLYNFDSFPEFKSWQEHNVEDPSNKNIYDFTIYNIVYYVKLLIDNNPNIIDSIFIPQDCILFSTPGAEKIRSARQKFLSKKGFHKFVAYMMSQLKKLDRKPEGKRLGIVEKYGYDTKFLSHSIRLALFIEQILMEHDLDIRRHSKLLSSVRNGEWSLSKGKEWIHQKELDLQSLFIKSSLREEPNYLEIKELLLDVLAIYFGEKSVIRNEKIIIGQIQSCLNEMSDLLGKIQ